jgi:LacI family transcriptional regulator
VARALRYIRQNACEGILARDVVRRATVCRASLMRSFRETVGRTILQEIIRVRLERACRLLRETNWTLEQIAWRTGFKTAPRLSRDFKKRLGLPPGVYRNQFRHG